MRQLVLYEKDFGWMTFWELNPEVLGPAIFYVREFQLYFQIAKRRLANTAVASTTEVSNYFYLGLS
jgi:hypothetical protein